MSHQPPVKVANAAQQLVWNSPVTQSNFKVNIKLQVYCKGQQVCKAHLCLVFIVNTCKQVVSFPLPRGRALHSQPFLTF